MNGRILAVVLSSLGLVAGVSCGDDAAGCQTDNDCKDDRICEAGACVSPDTGASQSGDEEASGEDSSGGSGSGQDSDTAGLPASCDETQTHCQDNILYDCITDAEIVNCRTCKYVGPGTGSEYDTSCKAQMSDCSVCTPDDPWDGAGCYFGGGPAVCRS